MNPVKHPTNPYPSRRLEDIRANSQSYQKRAMEITELCAEIYNGILRSETPGQWPSLPQRGRSCRS